MTGLLGINSAMFAMTMRTTVRRISQVQAREITQTEVRAEVNQVVAGLRDATTGGIFFPILVKDAGTIAFDSPIARRRVTRAGSDTAERPAIAAADNDGRLRTMPTGT